MATHANSGTPGLVRLEEIDDDHRLTSLVTSGRLADLVRELAQQPKRGCP